MILLSSSSDLSGSGKASSAVAIEYTDWDCSRTDHSVARRQQCRASAMIRLRQKEDERHMVMLLYTLVHPPFRRFFSFQTQPYPTGKTFFFSPPPPFRFCPHRIPSSLPAAFMLARRARQERRCLVQHWPHCFSRACAAVIAKGGGAQAAGSRPWRKKGPSAWPADVATVEGRGASLLPCIHTYIHTLTNGRYVFIIPVFGRRLSSSGFGRA